MAYPGQGYGPGGGGGGWHNQGPPQQQWGPPQQQGYGYNQGPPQHHYPPQQGYGYAPPQNQYAPQQQYHQGGYAPRGNAPPPPQGAQQFGHGAPQGYTFQYSACTGRRKALLIGINYFGTNAELKGCINDTRNVSSFLMEFYHYKREDMVILTDDQANPVLQPTKQNILRAMNWLVGNAQPNDSLFLHYSGESILTVPQGFGIEGDGASADVAFLQDTEDRRRTWTVTKGMDSTRSSTQSISNNEAISSMTKSTQSSSSRSRPVSV